MNFKNCHEAHDWLRKMAEKEDGCFIGVGGTDYKESAILDEIIQSEKIDHEKIAFDKLTGKYKHYCADWDDMAIDENCCEFICCGCYSNSENSKEVNKLKTLLQEDQAVWENSFINWLEGKKNA